MAEQQINNAEQIERVRRAVIQNGGSATVGDIVSLTGLNTYDAKEGLDALIKTHEGTLRVSDKGELLYAFAPGVVLRDQRSWWDRNKKKIYGVIKKIFKVIIFLVLVIYFIIYLVLLITLLTSNRNNNSNSGSLFHWGFYIFWGVGDDGSRSSGSKKKRQPIYTSVYNFVFGPEEQEVDPLQAKTQCAQLIRAKNGVITVEDWMTVSGQSREKCESDLARYTAEFEGDAQILSDGTIVYVFESMMKSTQQGAIRQMPSMAWDKLEKPRPLSGNVDGGNGIVIGLNIFNLLMSSLFSWVFVNGGMVDYYLEQGYTQHQAELLAEETFGTVFWLGFFPFLFSFLIFAVPLLRLPGNISENRRRRKRSIHKALLGSVFSSQGKPSIKVSERNAFSRLNSILRGNNLNEATPEEFREGMNKLCDELKGDVDMNAAEKTYTFDDINNSASMAEKERQKNDFNHQSVGNIVYSTDSDEQSDLDERNAQAEFDEELRKSQGYQPQYGQQYSQQQGYSQQSGNERQ